MSCRIETAGPRDEPLTLLELVAALHTVAESEREVVQIVSQLLHSGCVRRAGKLKEVHPEDCVERPSAAA